jgi:arsenate reductase
VTREASIYHNPACSKSRRALEILNERGVRTRIVLYLDEPPDRSSLAVLLHRLALTPRDIVRAHEAPFESLDLAHADDDALLSALAAHPILLERPIVVVGDRAVVARPPERVLELL